MNSSRRRLAAILEALGVPPSARRSAATPAAPACESLEGRQLLAGGLGFPGMGMGTGMADVAGHQGFGGYDSSSSQGTSGFGPGHWGRPGSTVNATPTTTNAAPTSTTAPTTSAMATTGQDPSAMSFGRFGGQDSTTGMAGPSGLPSFDTSSNQNFSMMPPIQFGGGGGDLGGGGFGAQDAMRSVQGLNVGSSADQAQLQTDLTKLQTDSQAIHDKSQVTPAMEATVRKDIKAIKGAETTTPSDSAQATLQADLKTAQANVGGPTDAQLAQIQLDQDAIYVSQGVNPALVTKLDTDLAAIKTASGVTADDEATLAADQAAVTADYAKLAPAPTPDTSSDPSSTTAPATPDLTAASITPPALTTLTAAPVTAPTTTATPAVVAATATPVTPTTPPLPTTLAATAPAMMTPMTPVTPSTTPVVPHGMGSMTGHAHRGRIGHGRRG